MVTIKLFKNNIRKSLIIALGITMVGCTGVQNKNKTTVVQKYMMVDAKVKKYHTDGTRTYNDYKPFKTRTIELLDGFESGKNTYELSKYGGWLKHSGEATGYFHVQKIDNRWWCIDPDGYFYFNIALNSLNMGKSERSIQKFNEKFGSTENWISETIKLLHDNGFNCAGSWSDVEAITEANKTAERPMPYTIIWNFMSSYGKERGGTFQQPGHTGYPNDAIFVFDPNFETFCDKYAQKLSQYKDDPNLFGYFSDNEMPFKYDALDNYLSLAENDYGYKAAVKWLDEQGITKEQITEKHRELFMAYVGEKYFSIVSKAIKKYDPNHMYIGSRFYGSEKEHEEFMRAVGKHLDVITNNYYDHWTPDSADVVNWTNWTGKPFIVTEYYTKGEDSGLPNTSGAGWIVRTQRDRGLFYQNYNLALIQSKNCVGWHYFKYMDNDPMAKGVDPSNIDANKGIVTCEYQVWEPMMELMKEVNTQIYGLIEYFDK
jgi:hypothetical protein